MIRHVNQPEDEGRIETGAVQFGDDWPGYFIRGDNAFAICLAIRGVLKDRNNTLALSQLKSFAENLLDCNLNESLVEQLRKEFGPMVERQTPTP